MTAGWLLVALSGSSIEANAPNFVLILTDDQAWNGTSVQMDPRHDGSKSDFYQTPRLEELAAGGLRFSNGYASTPVCATTRAAIQTGMSSAQLQMPDLPQALPPGQTIRWNSIYTGLPLTPPAPAPFATDNFTIPQMLKQADPNYVAAHFGKWHLDTITGATPQAVGYDFGEEVDELPPDDLDPWGVFELATRTNAFMEDRVANDEPFFVQISHKAVHSPVRSRSVVRQKYEHLAPGVVHNDPAYAAMTEDLDTSLGIVMDKVTELGIDDNTYIVFVSDNGAPISLSSSAPLRSGKATTYEGGTRVPFVFRGPAIDAGSFSDVPVTTTDLFATFAELAGHDHPLPSTIESASLVPVLHNGGELPTEMDHLTRNFHEGGEIYWHFPINFAANSNVRTRPSSSVRDGDYKLIVKYGEKGAPDDLFLYDLADHIGETVNLVSSMPAKAAELKAKLDRYLAAVDAPFAFDVEEDVVMDWDAAVPGAEQDHWRSALRFKNKGRETWNLGDGPTAPSRVVIDPFQPGLSKHAYQFDGGDVMQRLFFQVGDDGPYKASVAAGIPGPDFDRSATMEFWLRVDAVSSEQVLFESGDGEGGISVTLGDADADGKANDLRFRVLGLVGPDGGQNGTLDSLTVTAPIDDFSDAIRDFVHVVAVFSDDASDRYGEIYVNGALAGRVNGVLGDEQSLQWDRYDDAGLGNIGGAGLGGDGGSGELPFSGGFTGEFSRVLFYNHAIDGDTVRSNYNRELAPAGYGINQVLGDTYVPQSRPVDVALGSNDSALLMVLQERNDTLDTSVEVDALVTGPIRLDAANPGIGSSLEVDTAFTSYVLQFDPVGSDPLSMELVSGSIEFHGEILAILYDEAVLASTDPMMGSVGNYGVQASRGFEFSATDFLEVSADLRTMSYSLTVPGDEMLQLRVITEQPILGDFNHDGMVDGIDFALWQDGLGLDGGGDADGDGDTDGADFLIWQRRLTETAASITSAGRTVPEPTTYSLAFTVSLVLLCSSAARHTRFVR